MRSFENYLLAGSGVVVLLGSFVLGVPCATRGSDSKPSGPTPPSSFIQMSAARAPVTGQSSIARATRATSPALRAAAPDRSEDLSIDASLGDRQIAFERRAGGSRVRYMEIKLKEVIIASVTRINDETPEEIDLRARVTGEDRVPGSLLYALAWFAGDADPLGSVRALGYDIDVSKEHDRHCADGPPSQCLDHARRLATLLDATLALGSPDERLLFRQNAAALGVAPDCSARGPASTQP